VLSKQLYTCVLAISLVLSVSVAQQHSGSAAAGKVLEVNVPAPSLKGNLIGDPTEQPIFVYLPPSYETSPTKRYPTLYLLHGFNGKSRIWTTGAFQGFSLQPAVDQLIQDGKTREIIVVAANGWNRYGGSFYANSPTTGNWEDFIYRDLVTFVDSNYRTLARPESRGIAGHSMGGYGAIMMGMKHPDVFSALYALSPCCTVIGEDMSEANPVWPSVLSLRSKTDLNMSPQSPDQFFKLVFVAMSAAFSPNTERTPFYVDFPFQEKKGACPASPCLDRNETIYAKWRSHIPVYLVDENKANLLKLKGIFIDYGQREQFSHIRTGAKLFSQALAEHNIPHGFEVYADGDHGNKVRQRMETRVFEFFNEVLKFE